MNDAPHPVPLAEQPLSDRHKLGWGLAALVVAGNMIGSGLYLLPVSLAPTGGSSLIGWLVAAVGAATLALVFGALGRLQPDADGLAGFAERGLGRFAGFNVSLAFWAACLVGNVAVAVAATGYLGFFWPALRDPVAATFCNLGIIWIATVAYIIGARTASWLAALALVETVPASLAIIFWAYLGVESAAALSRRVRNPARDVGLASIAGVGLATLVYVAATVSVFGVIPLAAIAASTSPYADLAQRVFGGSIAGLVAVCAIIKTIGTVGGWVMMGGETARAAARQGYLPAGFGAGDRTPVANPLLGAAIMSVVTVLSGQPTLGGQFGLLVGVTSVLTLTVYAVCSASLFRLARRSRARITAVGGMAFATAAVAFAAPGYIVPSVGFFVLTTAVWFAVMRRSAAPVDPATGDA